MTNWKEKPYTHRTHRYVLGVAAASQNTAHLIAHLEIQAIIRHSNDRSRTLETGNVGGTLWRRVHALSLGITPGMRNEPESHQDG